MSDEIRTEAQAHAAGQRAINLIWETTQMRIALLVIGAALLVGATLGIFDQLYRVQATSVAFTLSDLLRRVIVG